MATIVLVEDDSFIVGPIVRALEGRGYVVHTARDGVAGLELALRPSVDLVILDIMLPGIDGWEVCKGIRRQSVVPILMLTALSEEVDRVLGLELGADDYLSKPFSTRELLARVKALLRRVEFDMARPRPTAPLTFGDLTIDLEQRVIVKQGEVYPLRFKEYELLSLLVAHAGTIVNRAEIFDKVWGTEWLGDMRTLDVHVRWLREKIEDDPGKPYWI